MDWGEKPSINEKIKTKLKEKLTHHQAVRVRCAADSFSRTPLLNARY